MAYFAELSAQTEELVIALTGVKGTADCQNDPQRLGALRDVTLRALRNHGSLRTNQFEVEDQLDGLEERFVVMGRDGLAEALRQRRDRLAEHASNRWTPDVLHFLLELSDSPVDKASLDELLRLCASREVPKSPPLRWEDIAREDGWADDDGRMANYMETDDDADDFFYDDDDDNDGVDDDDNNGSPDTTLSSMAAVFDVQQMRARGVVLEDTSAEASAALLQAVRDGQSWRSAAAALQPAKPDPKGGDSEGETLISELQLVREALFMLQGLDTTLFGARCVPVPRFRLHQTSAEAYGSLVASIAACGRELLSLRCVIARGGGGGGGGKGGDRDRNVPLLQVFEDAIRRRLQALDQEVAKVQARYVDIQQSVVVSVVSVMDELQPVLAGPLALAAIVQQLDSEAERFHAHAFHYLELLFDAVALAQLHGRSELYRFLGTLFFECFQVYLRPIRLWMEDGRLVESSGSGAGGSGAGTDKVFFVAGAAAPVALNQIWRSQFRLLRTSSGALHAPKFLQPAAERIFVTGKSIVVLKRLGRFAPGRAAADEPALLFDTVCPPGTELAPFAQLFSDAFERWIQSKHHAASATLRTALFETCHLWAALDALHCVYLMADGAAVDAFAARVFDSGWEDTGGERHASGWQHDRYTITELAREAFGPCLGDEGDARRLSAEVVAESSSMPTKHSSTATAGLAEMQSLRNDVARIRLSYRLAWPLQMVILPESMAAYQAVFTLLLQVRRASRLLSGRRLLEEGGGGGGSGGGGDRSNKTEEDDNRARYFSLRACLVWFCSTLHTYLTTLVVAPRMAALKTALRRAADVDAMADVHAHFLRALLDECCLGAKLQPIHEALLDLLDLALRLEDTRRKQAAHEAATLQETWRLSVLASPFHTPIAAAAAQKLASPITGSVRRRLFPGRDKRNDGKEEEAEDSEEDAEEDARARYSPRLDYAAALQEMSTYYSSYLHFVTNGLRGVARASSNAEAAGKWAMLAEMLDTGGRS